MNRMLVKQLAGGVKVVPVKNNNGMLLDEEWDKWLSYEPEHLKRRIEFLESKKCEDLFLEELEEIVQYRKYKRMAQLIKGYGKLNCSAEAALEVYDFMCFEDIGEFMESRLSEGEVKLAKSEIERLSKLSRDLLRKKVKDMRENYKDLSMVGAYVLHYISLVVYNNGMIESDRILKAELDRNASIKQKTMHYVNK